MPWNKKNENLIKKIHKKVVTRGKKLFLPDNTDYGKASASAQTMAHLNLITDYGVTRVSSEIMAWLEYLYRLWRG